MKKLLALSLRDTRNIGRDPILMIAVFTPLLLALCLRFGVPILSTMLKSQFGFVLTDHLTFFACMLLTIVPAMLGMLIGLLLLDERDEGLLSYYAVTPLMKKGYLFYRLGNPVAISFTFSIVLLFVAGLTQISVLKTVPAVLMLSLETPVIALFIAVAADNKVEGLAVAKASSILLLAPIINYFLQEQWQWVAMWLPTYWPSEALLAAEVDTGSYVLALLIGFALHVLLLWLFLRKFVNQQN
jgi:fluoroquinolone transport system permease protein